MDSQTVNGAAAVAHQVRTITVTFTQEPDGKLAIRAKGAPGWAALVRTHEQLAHAVHRAFVECQVAAYSRWKGETYDYDPYPDIPRQMWSRKRARRDLYPPDQWVKTEDGRWLSPGGRKYRPDSQMARNIVSARVRAGLPI